MRESEREEIGLPLIDGGPDRAAEKRKYAKQRIWKVNKGKQERDKQHALPTFPEDDLRATIQKTLEHVLLKESPEWDQQESPTHRWIIETRDKDDQRDGHGRRCEQELRRGEEVVKSEAEVVSTFFVDAVRKDHHRHRESNGNRENDFVRTDEGQDHPLGDQTRDN